MQSLTTGVGISSRLLTTGHFVAEVSQSPFASWAVQQRPCRVGRVSQCGRGLALDSRLSANECLAGRPLL